MILLNTEIEMKNVCVLCDANYQALVILGIAVIVPFGVLKLLLVVEKMRSRFTAKQWMLQSCPLTDKHCQWAWTPTSISGSHLIYISVALKWVTSPLCNKVLKRSSEQYVEGIRKEVCRHAWLGIQWSRNLQIIWHSYKDHKHFWHGSRCITPLPTIQYWL